MASIDRIYGSNEEYDEFYAWVAENIPCLRRYFWRREWYDDPADRRICSMPVWADVALYRKCPLEFVRARLRAQYGPDGPTTEMYREYARREREWRIRDRIEMLRWRLPRWRGKVYVWKDLQPKFHEDAGGVEKRKCHSTS